MDPVNGSIPFDPNDPGIIAKILLEGIANKQWGIVISVLVIAIIAALRRFVPETNPVGRWFRTKVGGVLTNLALSLGFAFFTQFAAGVPFNLTLVINAVGVALTAAGGWAIVKNLTEAAQERGLPGAPFPSSPTVIAAVPAPAPPPGTLPTDSDPVPELLPKPPPEPPTV